MSESRGVLSDERSVAGPRAPCALCPARSGERVGLCPGLDRRVVTVPAFSATYCDGRRGTGAGRSVGGCQYLRALSLSGMAREFGPPSVDHRSVSR